MPRRPRITIAGVPLHLIQRGNNRQACFFSKADYHAYLKWLQENAQRYSCAIHAYPLMTNHVHLLITPRTSGGAGDLMKRNTLVSLATTPYYHCLSRCVRSAFLCGEDTFTGNSYEHRRQWIEDRLLTLASIFAIDIAAYAVMSNHYHVVLHINHEKATSWTESDVIEHWHQLFKGSLLSQRYAQGETLSKAEYDALSEQANEWRERLMSISWFMRCSNEPIAREANHEDKVTGRF